MIIGPFIRITYLIVFACFVVCTPVWIMHMSILHQPLCLSRKLFGNVSANKHRLQVHPQVLHEKPPFQDLACICEVCYPFQYLVSEWRIVPVNIIITNCISLKIHLKTNKLRIVKS